MGFYETEFGGAREEAFDAAVEEIKKHGLRLDEIEFQYRTENLDKLIG